MQELSNGQKLKYLISKVLSKKKLTLVQRAVIEGNTYGEFEPTDLGKAHQEVMKLVKSNDITELIRLYKQLPKVSDESNSMKLYINDNQVSLQQYLDETNQGIRKITNVLSKPYSEMTLSEYSHTVYGSTKFESFGTANTIFSGAVPSIILNRTKKLTNFCPTAFQLITDDIIDKELLRNYELNSFQNVDAVLEYSEALLGYLTNLLKGKALIELYISKVWCSSTISKTQSVIPEVKPLPKVKGIEPTEVPISDEELDALDNVTVIGVSLDGKFKAGGKL